MMNQSEHRCVYRLLTNEGSLGDHVVQDVEGLGVSSEHQGAAHHVQAVDRQRLSGDQAVGLHPVLDSLVAEPRRHLREGVRHAHCVPPDPGAVPVTHVTTLAAGEHVIRLAGMELDLGDCRLVGRDEGGGMLGVAEIPHGEHTVLAPGHQNVGLGGVSGQTPHSATLQNISRVSVCHICT